MIPWDDSAEWIQFAEIPWDRIEPGDLVVFDDPDVDRRARAGLKPVEQISRIMHKRTSSTGEVHLEVEQIGRLRPGEPGTGVKEGAAEWSQSSEALSRVTVWVHRPDIEPAGTSTNIPRGDTPTETSTGTNGQEDADANKPDRREPFLAVAQRIVHGARNAEYGHPHEDFTRIASYWSNYLGERCPEGIEAEDVAALMILLKLGRLSHNLRHADSWIDIAGYVGCYDRIQRRRDGLGDS